MDRRRFVFLIGSALAAPLLARAQQARKPFRIGYPALSPLSALAPLTAAFEQGLRDLGHVPGQDVLIEYRSADAKFERYPEVVREIVAAGRTSSLREATKIPSPSRRRRRPFRW